MKRNRFICVCIRTIRRVLRRYRRSFPFSRRIMSKSGRRPFFTRRSLNQENFEWVTGYKYTKGFRPCTCRLRSKTAASTRDIPLGSALKETLRNHRENSLHRGLDDFVFYKKNGRR
jgi:hypothetical protein